MEGTLTFYLPLQRNATTSPEVTLVVRHPAEDQWQAGLVVCSRQDQFRKKVGRRVAYHRLCGKPIIAASAGELIDKVASHLDTLTNRRPYTISIATLQDLDRILCPIRDMRIIE